MSSLLEFPLDWQNFFEFEKPTKAVINLCYKAVEPRIIFMTKILPVVHKNGFTHFQLSMVNLVIDQHILKCIRTDKKTTKNLPNQ